MTPSLPASSRILIVSVDESTTAELLDLLRGWGYLVEITADAVEAAKLLIGQTPPGIALIDAATASPFAQLSMIPLLTLIAFYAPAGHRATWFALMASLMNMALVAGQLQTKYLNELFVVARGNYAELGPLLITAALLGLLIPLAAIALFGRRI